MNEPIWLRMDVVLAIHKRQIAEHGGDEGVRDRGLLESALARPVNRFGHAGDEIDLAALAAAYAFAICGNHPFADGNKRTSLVAFRTFLAFNGCGIDASQTEKYVAIMGLARGEVTEEAFAAWVRSHIAS